MLAEQAKNQARLEMMLKEKDVLVSSMFCVQKYFSR